MNTNKILIKIKWKEDIEVVMEIITNGNRI